MSLGVRLMSLGVGLEQELGDGFEGALKASHDCGVRLAHVVSCRDRYIQSLPTHHVHHVMRVSEAVLWQGRCGRMMLAASSPARDPAQSRRLAARGHLQSGRSLPAPRWGPGEVAPAPVPAVRGGDARGRLPGGGHLRRGAPRPSPVRQRGRLRQGGRSLLPPRCGLRHPRASWPGSPSAPVHASASPATRRARLH